MSSVILGLGHYLSLWIRLYGASELYVLKVCCWLYYHANPTNMLNIDSALDEWRKRKMERARQWALEKNGTVTSQA